MNERDKIELPSYTSHTDQTKVRAAKIAAVNGVVLTLEDNTDTPFDVPMEYIHKHHPQEGGYYVVQGDGKLSYSAAEEFDKEYKRDE
jgi:beta-lactam-binding protein with PASTA domain